MGWPWWRINELAQWIMLVLIVGALSFNTIAFDDREPMIVRNLRVITSVLQAGETTFRYEFDYDKRTECFPPLGQGEVSYEIWFEEGGHYNRALPVPVKTISYADPAFHHRETSVDIPLLQPGRYALQYHYTMECKGASQIFYRTGPKLPFEVAGSRAAIIPRSGE